VPGPHPPTIWNGTWRWTCTRTSACCAATCQWPSTRVPQGRAVCYGPNNCFWKLPDLKFLTRLPPKLQAYMAYAFARMTRSDFLRMLDEPPPEAVLREISARPHMCGRPRYGPGRGLRIVCRGDGQHRLVRLGRCNLLTRCCQRIAAVPVAVRDDGLSSSSTPTNRRTSDVRPGRPMENERALRESLPELYAGFQVA